MRFGNGIQKQTPLWIKFTMVLSAVVILPGAAKAIQLSPQDKVQEKPETVEEQLPDRVVLETVEMKVPILSDIPYIGRLFKNVGVVSQEPSRESKAQQAESSPEEERESGKEFTKTYDLSQLMHKADFLQTDAEQAEFVKNWLTYPFPIHDPKIEGKKLPQPMATPKPEYHSPMVVLDSTKQMMAVTTLQGVHDRIKDDIEYLSEFGFHQVIIETRFLSLEKQAWKNLGLQWQSAVPQYGNYYPRQDRDLAEVKSDHGIKGRVVPAAPVQSNSYVQRNEPTLFCLLNDQQIQKLAQGTQRNPQSTLLQAPTIITLNGQEASVDDLTERPFFTALNPVEKDGMVTTQPQVTFVEEGTRLVQRPLINEDRTGVQLNCELTLSNILKVDTFEIPQPDGKAMSIQIPKIDVRKVTSSLEIPDAQTLALTMVNQEEDDSVQLVVLVTCRILDPGKLNVDADKADAEYQYRPPTMGKSLIEQSTEQSIEQSAPVEFLPKLSIVSNGHDGQADETTDRAIQEALRKVGFDADIKGCVNFQFDGKTVKLRVNQSVVCVDGCQIESGISYLSLTQGDVRFQFAQGVRLTWPEVTASCDRLLIEDQGDAKFTLEGSAAMELGSSKMRADRLSINEANEILLLEGAVSWTGLDESNKSHRFEGQKIEYDLSSEALRLDGSTKTFNVPLLPAGEEFDVEGQVLPAAYYLEDDVQYFSPGPQFK